MRQCFRSDASKMQGLCCGTRTWRGLCKDRGVDCWSEGTEGTPSLHRTINVGARFFGGRPSLAELRKLNVPGVPSNAATSPSAFLDVWTCERPRRAGRRKEEGEDSPLSVQCLFSAAAVASAFQCCCSEKESWRRLEVMHHQAEAFGLEQVASMCWRSAPWCGWEGRHVVCMPL